MLVPTPASRGSVKLNPSCPAEGYPHQPSSLTSAAEYSWHGDRGGQGSDGIESKGGGEVEGGGEGEGGGGSTAYSAQ